MKWLKVLPYAALFGYVAAAFVVLAVTRAFGLRQGLF